MHAPIHLTSKRPIIFLGVGILNTVIDFSFYSFLTSVLFREDSQIAIAGALSGTLALLCAFITHGFITFRGSDVSIKTLIRFGLFTGFGMWIIRPVLLAVFIHFTSLYNLAYSVNTAAGLPFTREFIANTGAFGFMVIIVLAYNYYVYVHYVFASKSASRTEQESH